MPLMRASSGRARAPLRLPRVRFCHDKVAGVPARVHLHYAMNECPCTMQARVGDAAPAMRFEAANAAWTPEDAA